MTALSSGVDEADEPALDGGAEQQAGHDRDDEGRASTTRSRRQL